MLTFNALMDAWAEAGSLLPASSPPSAAAAQAAGPGLSVEAAHAHVMHLQDLFLSGLRAAQRPGQVTPQGGQLPEAGRAVLHSSQLVNLMPEAQRSVQSHTLVFEYRSPEEV